MANARLLRQYIGDYNKKLAAEQGAYEDRYAGYKTQYDAYTQQVNAYNQKIEQFNAGTRAMVPGDVYQNEVGVLLRVDDNGSTAPFAGQNIFGQNYPTYRGKDGNWYIDLPNDLESPDAGTTPMQIALKGVHPGAAPTAPAEPAAPAEVRQPNLTQGDVREMQNPGLDQAQLAMSAARGYIGKSALAGDAAPTSNSAFANLKGDDPNQLKDKGLLAQAVAGQI